MKALLWFLAIVFCTSVLGWQSRQMLRTPTVSCWCDKSVDHVSKAKGIRYSVIDTHLQKKIKYDDWYIQNRINHAGAIIHLAEDLDGSNTKKHSVLHCKGTIT